MFKILGPYICWELWNKLHFEDEKKRRVYTMFKIFGTFICWELWNKLHFEEEKKTESVYHV